MRRIGTAVLFLTAAACSRAPEDAPPPAPMEDPPNIVVVVMDTARRDHFSTYGYEKETTPVFTALSEESIRFDRAYSTSSWTVPSHASLFTGLYTASHGANQETQRLTGNAVTLAEILTDHGFDTACFSSNPWISHKGNLDQGFAKSRVVFAGKVQAQGTGLPHQLNKKVFQWLDQRDDAAPFFLFVNHIEAHWKYIAPAEYQKRFVPGGREVPQSDDAMFSTGRWYIRPETIPRELLPIRTGMYDADLAYADAILGELVEELRTRGVLDDTVLIVLSDHGENTGDGGHLGHMFALTEATIRVPMIVRLPDGEGAGSVRTDPVQVLDLFPTILSLVGLEAGPETQGYDFLSAPVPADRPVFTEYYYPEQVLGVFPDHAREDEDVLPLLRRTRSVQIEGHKFVWGSDGVHELYDLNTDPAETTDRIRQDPDRAAALQARLLEMVEEFTEAALEFEDEEPEAPVDPEIQDQLRSLGYVK